MSSAEDAVGVVRHLEGARFDAALAGDVDRLETLLHDRLIYAHSTGSVEGKRDVLTRLRSGYYDYRRVSHLIDEIVVADRTAVVRLRMDADVVVAGQLRHIRSRALGVWVTDGEQWRLLAFQPAPLEGA